MGRRLYIDRDGRARVDRRHTIRRRELDWVYQAWRLCQAYANPLRGQMPLSSTEVDAAKAAARILRGRP